MVYALRRVFFHATLGGAGVYTVRVTVLRGKFFVRPLFLPATDMSTVHEGGPSYAKVNGVVIKLTQQGLPDVRTREGQAAFDCLSKAFLKKHPHENTPPTGVKQRPWWEERLKEELRLPEYRWTGGGGEEEDAVGSPDEEMGGPLVEVERDLPPPPPQPQFVSPQAVTPPHAHHVPLTPAQSMRVYKAVNGVFEKHMRTLFDSLDTDDQCKLGLGFDITKANIRSEWVNLRF